MSIFRIAIRAAGLSACLMMTTAVAHAGLIDDGANDASHIALANESQYDAVGVLFRNVTVLDSSAVLIAPGWALTAAHTEVARVPVPAIANTFTIGGETRTIVDAIRHPSYSSIEDGFDIALLELDSPINTVTPAQLYTGTAASLVGENLTYVGYGRSGTGSTGDTIAAGTKRAGKNKGDQLGYTINPGPEESIYSNQIMFADMDKQGGPWGNPLGGTNPISLEYLIALGDSGGGLFIEQGGQHYLAGVHSIVFDFDPAGTLGYGDIMGSTTIEQSLAWIIDAITPDPIVGDLDGDFFVGINDINIILSNWNLGVTPGDLTLGDPSGDGFVGILDLNIVLGNWNAGTPPSIGQLLGAVPEPGMLTILTVAGLGLVLRRRR
jgi:hypothetical protein